MRLPDIDARPGSASEPVNLYCLGAMLADQASRTGYREFARALESALDGFLSCMPREQQADALLFSFAMAAGGEQAAPRLRLVHSRD